MPPLIKQDSESSYYENGPGLSRYGHFGAMDIQVSSFITVFRIWPPPPHGLFCDEATFTAGLFCEPSKILI